MLKKHAVEVVNPHYIGLEYFSFLLLRRLGLFRGRIVLSYHGSDLATLNRSGRLPRILHAMMLGMADGAVAVSRSMLGSIPNAKVFHNGLDVRYFLGRAEPCPLPEATVGKELVVCVANFEGTKGQDVLVRAFERVAAQYPSSHLVLAGRDSSFRIDIERQIDRFGLRDRVTLLIDLPNAKVASLMQRAAMVALPSRSEAFGIVILEAGAARTPVVASRVGGIPEIITHNETGLLVPPDDDVKLADAIGQLLSDGEKRERMGMALHAAVVSEFTWEATYRKYEHMLSCSFEQRDFSRKSAARFAKAKMEAQSTSGIVEE
ncbi:MAG TPA: glycosyltransferase family 4 protein [Alphaproteobacteria bacterium]|nr:glycosyltransferase family 4 protein [Alphaproteobacteria bacterium]